MTREASNYHWLSAALAADNGAAAMDARIKPLLSSWRIFGRALTVKVPEGDNLAVHAALSMVKRGEVLVVDAGGYPNRAIMGGLMTRQALALGVAGVIIDGAVRDTEELRALGLPMFSAATHPAGPTKTGGGAVAQEICCGGVAVRNGDWILADADGIAVIPDQDFDAVAGKAHEKLERETARIKAIESGDVFPAWLSTALQDASDKVQMPA
ncbi:MAG: RraA family protein [Noviherbaspirillum sp.]